MINRRTWGFLILKTNLPLAFKTHFVDCRLPGSIRDERRLSGAVPSTPFLCGAAPGLGCRDGEASPLGFGRVRAAMRMGHSCRLILVCLANQREFRIWKGVTIEDFMNSCNSCHYKFNQRCPTLYDWY